MSAPLRGLSRLFDDVVVLRRIEQDSQMRRAVAVPKTRDSDHDEGLRQFVVDERGLTLGDRPRA